MKASNCKTCLNTIGTFLPIYEGIQDHMAFYRNTIMPNGNIEISLYWAEG